MPAPHRHPQPCPLVPEGVRAPEQGGRLTRIGHGSSEEAAEGVRVVTDLSTRVAFALIHTRVSEEMGPKGSFLL